MNSREYDIVVLGATGYVGRRLVSELSKVAGAAGFKVLATARALKKVEELRRDFLAVNFEVLNVGDQQEVDRVVQKAKLVVNCIGPFDLYGEAVVSACARAGTHYLDITGEILFARRMIERYDEIAKKTGAMIVSFAGFDSVPADMAVFLTGHEMKTVHQQAVTSVDVVFKMSGGVNGGSAATALDMGSKLLTTDQKNLNFLVPSRPSREVTEMYRPRYVPRLKKWVAPFFMEPINNKVVYRSLALGDPDSITFTKEFLYRESVSVPQGWVGAAAVGLLLKGSHHLLKTSLGRRLAARVMPTAGSGPTESEMINGFFAATVVAIGERGHVLVKKMKSKGDPGNVSTVKLLMACILTLLKKDFIPKAGLLTPATAFGHNLLPALKAQGVSWE